MLKRASLEGFGGGIGGLDGKIISMALRVRALEFLESIEENVAEFFESICEKFK